MLRHLKLDKKRAKLDKILYSVHMIRYNLSITKKSGAFNRGKYLYIKYTKSKR